MACSVRETLIGTGGGCEVLFSLLLWLPASQLVCEVNDLALMNSRIFEYEGCTLAWRKPIRRSAFMVVRGDAAALLTMSSSTLFISSGHDGIIDEL